MLEKPVSGVAELLSANLLSASANEFVLLSLGGERLTSGWVNGGLGLRGISTLGFSSWVPGFNSEIPEFKSQVLVFNVKVPGFNSELPGFKSQVPGFNSEIPGFCSQVPEFN